ncbi:MAG: HAMP domain-containing sensor histidine kinase [Candidatus Limiplasma sp.]|nr:HAMP domain-containing sensor histidine kinase [Candidatus Limiplasma sp.]
MKKRRLNRFGLSVVFSLVVFLIFLITALIVLSLALLALHLGLVERLGLKYAFPLIPVALLASAIVGTLVALMLGHIPLRPIREIIDATNRLAAGDFSVRIHACHPPEMRELRDSFNRMAQELSSIELLRSDFVNNFSHEFKTPIVSIKGFAELLRQEELTPAERAEYLEIIIRESSRLATLATNVLNLSRVENQAIVADRKPYDLSEQVRRCVLLMQSAWELKNLHLDIDLDEVRISANEELLQQLWVNLLDNAVKFTPDGGAVKLRLQAEGGTAVFTLQDDGPGIGAQELPHIFDKFYQADSTRAVPGNGLGLALAQKIVQLHGGTITCESEPGQGAAFTVRLPLG